MSQTPVRATMESQAATSPHSAAAVLSKRPQLLLAPLLVVLLLATGLRFYRLDAQSFWNDEGNSARLSERSIPLIIEGTASDIHPPLYYLLLRGWRALLGDSEFSLRAFSAFVGVLTVAGTIALAPRLLGRRGRSPTTTGLLLIAGLLAAVNPALVYYSQEARMYALLALLAVLATLALWGWLGRRHFWPAGLLYVLVVTAGLYTHYFFPVVLALHGIFLLLLPEAWPTAGSPMRRSEGKTRRLISWLGLVAASLLLYAPWLPVFLRQASGRDPVRAAWLTFVADAVQWQVLGATVAPGALRWVVLLTGLLAAWGILAAGRRAVLPLLGSGLPILAMLAAGTTQPAFFKFMLLAVPFLVVALAAPFARPGKNAAARTLPWIPWLGLAALLGATAVSLSNLYFNPDFARDDYRAMAARIAAEDHPNAGIILDAPNQWEVFTYYHQDGAPVYPLPKGQPDPALLEPELAAIAARHQRLYALFWGEDQRDPQRIVERWLDANAFKTDEQWVGDVRLVVYALPDETVVPTSYEADQPFGESIALESYTLRPEGYRPGDIVPVVLTWTTRAALDERYKVFLHLVDEDGVIVSQRDSEPTGGLLPTTAWEPGQVVVDRHGILLPADLSSGAYTLFAGLYNVSDPSARLPLGSTQFPNDAFPLGVVKVE